MKIFILLFLFCFSVFAQETDDGRNFEQFKFDRLKRIRKELVDDQEKIEKLKSFIESEKNLVTRLKYESELLNLQKKFDQNRFHFIETATNVNLDFSAQSPEPEKRDLLQEIHDLISPALEGIRRLSEKPRQIEKTKKELEEVSEKLSLAQKAANEMQALRSQDEVQNIKVTMRKVTEFAENVVNDLKIKKEDLEFKILNQQKLKGSVFEEVSRLVLEFIKTKGKNLLFSLLAFVACWWFFNLFKEKLLKVLSFKLGSGPDSEYRHWAIRTVRVLYNVLNSLVSTFAGIGTLYILNDWVLVTFILISIGAFLWGTRSYIPMFMDQLKLVLNIGPIREGERIIYHGLPWLVKGLGFYCRLVNPQLSGGDLRISSKELLSLHSRPTQDKEPWFPSSVNEWVELSDGVIGEVILQSPEQVVLKTIGGMTKYYPTLDFLKLNPLNFSRHGFTLEIIEGIDYSHQAFVVNVILPKLKDHMQNFKKLIEGIKDIVVSYDSNGESSLNMRIQIICEGSAASRKFIIERKAHEEFLNFCNIHRYIIPFKQLQVHMSEKSQ
jgi:hypothetical protein